MKVSVFGLGYVGSVTAACLASLGHEVIGVDVNSDKVDTINKGDSPIIEPGLDRLIQMNVGSGKLSATQDTRMAVEHGEVLLICVGTPSDATGNLNFEYLDRVCSEIGYYLRDAIQYKIIVIRSTILPGVLQSHLIPLIACDSGKHHGQDFGVVINPEFLREGSALDDFMNPPFTLIGVSGKRDGDILEELYANISAPIYRTDPDTACMVKYASNAFHGLKVAFANEIGQICKRVGIDGTEVMNIFCHDTRLNISTRYLRPGFAFGGSCLPKDLRALQYLARHNDLQIPIIEAILPSNHNHIQNTAKLILKHQVKRLGIVGLAFKPGTDDLRESPVVELVEILSGKGIQVKIYDEYVNLSRLVGANKAHIERAIPHISCLLYGSLEEIIESSDAVVVAHNLPEIREKLSLLLKSEQLLIDLIKFEVNENHFRAKYHGICW